MHVRKTTFTHLHFVCLVVTGIMGLVTVLVRFPKTLKVAMPPLIPPFTFFCF